MVLIEPEDAEKPVLSTEQILKVIDDNAADTALVLLPGIQYYTGQYFDIKTITAHAHSKGILIGWDCAHAVGNVELKLHEWDVDFATWCHYKYVNSGPGAMAGLFVHEKHGKVDQKDSGKYSYRPRLAGWWGQDKKTRFQMDNSTFSSLQRRNIKGKKRCLAYPLLLRIHPTRRSSRLSNFKPFCPRPQRCSLVPGNLQSSYYACSTEKVIGTYRLPRTSSFKVSSRRRDNVFDDVIVFSFSKTIHNYHPGKSVRAGRPAKYPPSARVVGQGSSNSRRKWRRYWWTQAECRACSTGTFI